MIEQLIEDAIFSAVAAVGFSALSNPPRRAYAYCAAIAAAGHCSRYALINAAGWHIVGATLVASLLIGVLAVLISPRTKTPAETYLYPSLLPMIPGIYAYRTVGALIMCLGSGEEGRFDHYLYLFASNGLTTLFILIAMTVGATVPMFMLKHISFTATRT